MGRLWALLLLPTLLATPATASSSSSASLRHPPAAGAVVTMWTTVVESTVTWTTSVAVQPSVSIAAQLKESSGPPANTDSSGASSSIPTVSTLFPAMTGGSWGTSSSRKSVPSTAAASSASGSSRVSSSSVNDPLAVLPSSTTTIGDSTGFLSSGGDGLAVGTEMSSTTASMSSSSNSDPLAIETRTSGTAASSSSATSGSASVTFKSQSSASRWQADTPASSAEPKQDVGPCASGYPHRLEDCRVEMASSCRRSLRQYPTCVGSQCVCMAAPCSSKGDCQPYGQCFEDEEARCSKEPALYPHFPGVCECAPRGDGCLATADPHKYCDGLVDCTDRHRSPYPMFPQCVTEDEWATHPRGRCMCRSVDCDRGDGQKDDEACKGLVWCSNSTSPDPVCTAKHGVGEDGDGYCTCRWRDQG